jgi:hypothetical protein
MVRRDGSRAYGFPSPLPKLAQAIGLVGCGMSSHVFAAKPRLVSSRDLKALPMGFIGSSEDNIMTTETLLNTAAVVGHNKAVELPKLTDTQKDAIAKTMVSLSDELAKTFPTDEVDTIIVRTVEAGKDVAAGPWLILKVIKSKVEPGTLAKFPTPGSEVGLCPDKYEEPYFKDGNKKFRKTSFYLKFFLLHMPEGKRIAAALAHIAIAKDENANQAAVPEVIRAMNPVDLENYREDLVSQQNKGVKALRDAMALEKQLVAVNKLAGCAAAPLMDKEGNVRRTSKPVKVWNTENADSEWKLYSISGFMQFDADAAAENGGTFDALKLTAKREQEDGEDGGDPATSDAPVAINTNKTFAARIGDIHEFIVNKLMGDPKRELYGLFLKEHIATAGSDDLIEAIDDLRAFCAKITSIPTVAARLEEISNKPVADAA